MTVEKPSPFVFEDNGEVKRHAPATERNRDAIAQVLANHLPDAGLVLEIASGTGEHIVHFASCFPNIDWQPSDMSEAALGSIAAWSAEAALPKVHAPLHLDVEKQPWPIDQTDAALCINMVHICPWSAVLALFAGAAQILKPGGMLYLYGPFFEEGVEAAPGNLSFDKSLKDRNPEWGIRSVQEIEDVADQNGFVLAERVEMPANNLSLIFRK